MLFINNLTRSIIPEAKPGNNLYLQTSLLVKESTNKDDIVIERGGEFWPNGTIWPTSTSIYIPYFARRRLVSFMDIHAESLKASEETELSKLKKEVDQAIDSGMKVLVLQNALIVNSENVKYAYPVIYSKLSSLLLTEYHISKYREKNGVVIYKLAKKNS